MCNKLTSRQMQYTTLQHFLHTYSTAYSLLISLNNLNPKRSLPICILFNKAVSKVHVSLYARSNVDSTQLQNVTIDPHFQLEQTKENCEKPCLVYLVYQLRYELGMSSMLSKHFLRVIWCPGNPN